MSEPQSLANKVAIVTGAAKGIGKLVSENLARDGAHTALVGHRRGKGQNARPHAGRGLRRLRIPNCTRALRGRVRRGGGDQLLGLTRRAQYHGSRHSRRRRMGHLSTNKQQFNQKEKACPISKSNYLIPGFPTTRSPPPSSVPLPTVSARSSAKRRETRPGWLSRASPPSAGALAARSSHDPVTDRVLRHASTPPSALQRPRPRRHRDSRRERRLVRVGRRTTRHRLE